jgi:chemotaxis protein histidine kinase CheA
MSAVAQSMQAVGGKIQVTSRLGQGTEFELWIPKTPALQQARRVA